MHKRRIALLTVAMAGCGGSTNAGTGGGATTTTSSPITDAGQEAGALTPTWTSFASRGTDSRWGVPLAYSTKSNTFLAFGGSAYPSPAPGGMFSFSAATGTWTKLTDTNEPDASWCSCTTYLPDQDQVLLFMGLDDSGPAATGAWIFDVASGAWSQVTGAIPQGGIGCAATYMPGLGKAVIFGGLSTSGYSAETWSYDPAAKAFTKLSPASSPPQRADSIAAYDPGNGGRMLMFAGTQDEIDNKGHLSDLWSFDGTTWTQLMPKGGPPPPRRVAAGGFDATRRRWVVFGGTVETMDYGDLWVLDVGTLTWTMLPGMGAPSARGFSSAGYDPGTDGYFVVGGFHQPQGVTLTDGWKLTLQ